jgi:MFS family permease
MTTVDSKTRNRVLFVLFVGVLMGALDIAIVGPALPAIRRAFSVDDRATAWIFTMYVLFNLIGTPLMAKLSDTFGRRLVYIVDVLLFALGSVVVICSPFVAGRFAVFLTGRALQGLGAGGIFPVASAVIGDTFPPEKRGGALGLIGAVFGLAFIIGPILGGLLLMLGWQWLFVINLPMAALVIALSLRFIPGTRAAAGQPRLDGTGMLTLGVLLALLTFGINQIDTAHFVASVFSLSVWPYLAGAVALLAVFVWLERRHPDPVLRLSLLSTRQTQLASALSMGAGLGEAGLVFMPSLAVAALGMKSSTASFMLMPVVLALMVGSPTVGRLLDRFGSKFVVMGGTALLSVGMLVLALFSGSLALFIVAGILVGLGLAALLGAPMRYIMLNEAPAADRAAAQGLVTLNGSVGQLISGAMVGAVSASQGGGMAGYSAAFLVIGCMALALTLLTAGLKGRAAELATLPAATRAPAAD